MIEPMPDSQERWRDDKDAFEGHFKIPYEDFMSLVEALTPEQATKYEKIRAAHEEAAILWAIHEGKSHGLLE